MKDFFMDKRGIELAISTIIITILGVLVLIGVILILVNGWDNFKENIKLIVGGEVSANIKNCEVQCNLENYYDFCCESKNVKNINYTCQDSALKGDCVLDCSKITC